MTRASKDLRALARMAGLDVDYVNWRGQPAIASDEAIRQMLAAFEPELGIAVEADDALAQLEQQQWSEVVGPAVVAWDGDLEVVMRVAADRDAAWTVDVEMEDGRAFTARGSLFDLPADSHAYPGGRAHCARRARVFLDGAWGYGTLTWRVGDTAGQAMVIAAPTRAWRPPGPASKCWGVFAPVYGLASRTSGAAGDLSSLRTLMRAVERSGGRYVATLPLLAAFFAESSGEFSPYSPVSRMFWNEVYLDLPRLGAELGVEVPVPAIASGRNIDYREQYAWRRPVIDRLTAACFADSARREAVCAWATEHGVWDYAAFRAIGEVRREPWRVWPEPTRSGIGVMRTREDALHSGAESVRVDSHVFAQWAMSQQLGALRNSKAALYLDLPVGVSIDAYDVWRYRHLFLTSLAAGAPPDALFLGGQNWGLPPVSPIALRRDKYRYWIDCVRHHVRVSGLLRIDHVMGLFRLYCVPEGRPATDGVYLRYPAGDLLAILTLESARAHCAVAGEDLGTVPDYVRPAMAKHGLYRLHVGQWHFPSHPGDVSDPAPADSIASLNTHDTATFAGWWTGADITDKRELGLIDEAQERSERQARDASKAAVAAMAADYPSSDPLQSAMTAVTVELARGPAAVVLVALDDVALERVPHNVPGTTSERPNWHRCVEGWETAVDSEVIQAVAAIRPRVVDA